MDTFSALLVLCAGNSPVTDEFPSQRPVTRSFDVFFDLRLNKQLKNNREAGDLRRYHAHYDVTLMKPGCRELMRHSVKITLCGRLTHFTTFEILILSY